MSDGGKRRQLGRGLTALLGDLDEQAATPARHQMVRMIERDRLHPSPFQPRRTFDEEALGALAASIATQGVLQPLVARALNGRPGEYEIVAGERRWRAAHAIGLDRLPVIVRELSDRDTLEVALIENVQRQDLSALDEADGYRRLIDEFGHTHDALATALGKSRSHIANALRLLTLPIEVRELVARGSLSAGHARAVLNTPDPAALAQTIARRGLSVRDAERLARLAKAKLDEGPGGAVRSPDARTDRRVKAPPADQLSPKHADTLALERDLSELLGLAVTIDDHGGAGQVALHYASLEQLDEIIQGLNHLTRSVAPNT